VRAASLASAALLIATAGRAEPLKEPVDGPQLICFKYSTFQLLKGERIVDFSGGMESMSVRVLTPHGQLTIAESEIFAVPTRARQKIAEWNGTKVYRYGSESGRYGLFGKTAYSADEDRLVIWLSIMTLMGTSDDAAVYRRFDVRDPAGSGCKRGFTYGWEFLRSD
jgi:hypothetical protein